jgi:hypothetical protein
METISSIQESDTSAIDRIEAERARQRQEASDAANAATRRSTLLKSGAGVGAAAAGIGLGAMLVLYGVSLVIERPTLEEVVAAMRDQVTKIEHQANEKVALAERAAADKLAAADRAAAGKIATAEQKAAAAEKAVADAGKFVKKFESAGSSKTVVDFTIFRRREVGSLMITTGWSYNGVGDTTPSRQWCYISEPSNSNSLSYHIAVDGIAVPFDSSKALRAGLTQAQVRQALPECEWFRGSNPNIVDKN